MKDKRLGREEDTGGWGVGSTCSTEGKCSLPRPSSSMATSATLLPSGDPNPEYGASHLEAQGIVVPRATHEHPPPPEAVVRIKSMAALQNNQSLPGAHGGGHLSTAPKPCATQEAR